MYYEIGSSNRLGLDCFPHFWSECDSVPEEWLVSPPGSPPPEREVSSPRMSPTRPRRETDPKDKERKDSSGKSARRDSEKKEKEPNPPRRDSKDKDPNALTSTRPKNRLKLKVTEVPHAVDQSLVIAIDFEDELTNGIPTSPRQRILLSELQVIPHWILTLILIQC